MRWQTPPVLRFCPGSDARTWAPDNKLDEGFDPVTVADRAAEEAMRAVLARERPEDGIWGEEFGKQPGRNGLTWVLDPIDGTRGFISGTPTWGVLIALSDETGPMMGIVDQPYTGERFLGGFGTAELSSPHGVTSLASRGTTELSDAILFTTFPEVGTAQERAGFEAVASKVKLTRYGDGLLCLCAGRGGAGRSRGRGRAQRL